MARNDDNKIRRKTVSKRGQDSSSNVSDIEEYRKNKNSKIKIKKQAGSSTDVFFSSREEDNKNRRRTSRKVKPKNLDVEEYYDDDREFHPIILRFLKRLITILLVLVVVGGSIGFVYVRSVVSSMPEVTKKMVQESYINKDPVSIKRIPKDLQNAIVAVEDQRFYEHKGIDYMALVRSFFSTIRGDGLQGGSTIDMQLSKNLLTSNEKTLNRKIKDIYNAQMINKVMTKEEILEAYLNNIYLGKSAYGVEAGAKQYFGKDVWQLSFGESTMLAGITNSPGLYQDYEKAKKRQEVVLYRMYKLGYIKEEEYKAQLYRDTPFKSEIDK